MRVKVHRHHHLWICFVQRTLVELHLYKYMTTGKEKTTSHKYFQITFYPPDECGDFGLSPRKQKARIELSFIRFTLTGGPGAHRVSKTYSRSTFRLMLVEILVSNAPQVFVFVRGGKETFLHLYKHHLWKLLSNDRGSERLKSSVQ